MLIEGRCPQEEAKRHVNLDRQSPIKHRPARAEPSAEGHSRSLQLPRRLSPAGGDSRLEHVVHKPVALGASWPAAANRWIYTRDLLYELVGRDMKLRYKRSVLGILWSLLNPLAYLLVLTFLFRRVVPLDIPHYRLFVFTGILAWNWFNASLTGATASITTGREFIRQPGFPVAILPAVTILSNLVHFLLALGLLLVILVASGGWLSQTVLVLPLVILLQFVMTLGIAYFTATLNVTFRDTHHLLGVILMLGFFLTPVFYHARSVPEAYQPIYRLNPMVHLIGAYRDVIIQGRWPDAEPLIFVAMAATALLWLGHRLFVHASYEFAEEL